MWNKLSFTTTADSLFKISTHLMSGNIHGKFVVIDLSEFIRKTAYPFSVATIYLYIRENTKIT